ncbi:MAG: BamA/TamA family outer membrane protein [Cyclobacteriaceae bacterium]
MLVRPLLLLLLLASSGLVHAQMGDSRLLRHFRISSKDTTTLNRRQLTFFPVVYRSPETGTAFGTLALGLFKMIGVKDQATRTSNLEMPIIYTMKRQFVVDLLYNLITNKERFFIRGVNVYNQSSEFFFGVGNHTPENNRTQVDYNMLRSTQRVTARINGRHFLGLQYQYFKMWKTHFEKGIPPPADLPGHNGFETSGAGFVYLYDSRDNVINSSKGAYLDISNYFFGRSIGSNYSFNNVIIDGRKFYSVGKKQVLALQAVFQYNEGNVPWRQLANMGGFNMMRGFYQGRHRDRDYVAAQVEYRFPVWKYLGMTVFAATGEVEHSIGDFSLRELKLSGGTGIRVQVDKKERVNIRFDMGFTSRGLTGFYVNIGEAF